MLVRTATISNDESQPNDWEVSRIPHLSKDEYAVPFVFRRGFAVNDSSFITIVLFDSRPKLLRTGLKHRIQFRVCDGAVSNLGLCPHAFIIIKKLRTRIDIQL